MQGRRGFASAAKTANLSRFEQKKLDYESITNNLEKWRKNQKKNRPLTLAEKILYSHLDSPSQNVRTHHQPKIMLHFQVIRGESYLKLRPDRVAMQDASAQMALLQV
jgi:aconitase A